MKYKKIFLGLLFFSLAVLILNSGITDPNLSRALDSIRPQNVYDYCKTMALPKYAGRLTGHEGYTAAAGWAAGLFKRWGLKPMNNKEGYLQAYPSPYTVIEEAEMSLLLPQKKKETQQDTTS